MTQAHIPLLLTERDTTPPEGTVVVTPERLPNGIIRTMTPIAQVLVRGLRTFLQCLVAFLGVATVGKPMVEGLGVMLPPMDALHVIYAAAGFALFPTLVSVIQNTIELLAKLDESFKYVKLRA